MTWIKTVPLTEADEKLRQAIEAQKALYPIEYASPVHPTGDGASAHRGIAQPDPGGALPCVCDIRRADVPGIAAGPAPARDDHDRGFRHEQVPLLNRIARRVSASGDTGRRTGSIARRGLHTSSDYVCRACHVGLRGAADEGCDAHRAKEPRASCAPRAYDDRAILQITLIASWFNYINRVADALGVGRE